MEYVDLMERFLDLFNDMSPHLAGFIIISPIAVPSFIYVIYLGIKIDREWELTNQEILQQEIEGDNDVICDSEAEPRPVEILRFPVPLGERTD